MSLTRKEFLSSVVTAVAGVTGAAVLLGCSDNGGSNDAGVAKNCSTNGAAPAIGSNHAPPGDHKMTVPSADVIAGVEKTYNIQGNAGHMHMVVVTAANFASLKANSTAIVTAMSTPGDANNHTHIVMIYCA